MLDVIRKFFESNMLPKETEDDTHSLHLSCAALLYEVARMDFHVQGEELSVITQLIKEKFDLSPGEASQLLEAAEQETNNTASYHEFTSLINQRFSYEQKTRLIEMMWRVAYIDRRLDRYEEHLVRKIAELLYVSHVDFIQAKHRVQATLERQG